MIDIEWSRLRPLAGSSENAFEELVSQLMDQEPLRGERIRKGTPDAGVEQFWRLPNGDEIGVQAKNFDAFNAGRWGQIDKSVKTALSKHPKLRRYIIAVPLDRSDARLAGRRSALQAWEAHVKKWRKLPGGAKVTFEYWGDHEIRTRLQKPGNEGLVRYWFNKTSLTQEWFEEHAREARVTAGPRYTPEVHVDLPIALNIEAFGRDATYRRMVNERAKRLQSVANRAYSTNNAEWDTVLQRAATVAGDVARELRRHTSSRAVTLDLRALTEKLGEAANGLYPIVDATAEHGIPQSASPKRNARELNISVRAVLDELHSTIYALEDTPAICANSNLLILAGEAGMGKTHLLVDIAQRRVKAGEPTILLFGEHFNNGTPPLRTIVDRLGLAVGLDELLPTLQAAAVARNARLVIVIDALNEATGRDMWQSDLPVLYHAISKYSNLALLVSVRSTYEADVIREDLASAAHRLEHEGFADVQFSATQAFFNHYEINYPSTPLLLPEYRNPLFLRLLCHGLKETGQRDLPLGLHGMRALFSFFLNAVNKKAAKKSRCDYLEDDGLALTLVDQIAIEMATCERKWLPIGVAERISQAILSRLASSSLLHHLISEGVLKETTQYVDDGLSHKLARVVEFGYERLGEHAIAHALITQCGGTVKNSDFQGTGRLTFLIDGTYTHAGTLEAVALYVAEEQGVELPDLVPSEKAASIVEPFLRSLSSRNPRKLTARSVALAEEAWASSSRLKFGVLLATASSPGHLLDANYLHAHLWPLSMRERDASWSTHLHYARGRMGPLDRLVGWVQGLPAGARISIESGNSTATTLAWTLATSHRELRDTATRCLVKLLDHQPALAIPILEKFRHVNDPYVLERVTCAAYGHALRNPQANTTIELAQAAYRLFFLGDTPVHILTRDYARGIVEVGLRAGAEGIQHGKVKPPYGATWIEPKLTLDELRSRVYSGAAEGSSATSAAWALWTSTMEWGDFARYIIGSNTSFEWQDKRLDGAATPTRAQRIEGFVKALTQRQRILWDALHKAKAERDLEARGRLARDFEMLRTGKMQKPSKLEDRTSVTSNVVDNVRAAEQAFAESLDEPQKAIFHEIHPQNPTARGEERPLSIGRVQRAIMTRILEMGWDAETFGDFDHSIGHGRTRANKPRVERIGKKYQWIAYHEVLARAADTFFLRDGSTFDTPAQFYLRDIDPSVVRQKVAREYYDSPRTWWFPAPAGWNECESNLAWLKDKSTWPEVAKLLMPTDSSGRKWLMLESHFSVSQPRPLDEPKDYENQRIIQGWPEAFFVRRAHTDAFVKWLKKSGNAEGVRSHNSGPHNVFLGEFPNGAAFLEAEGGYGRTEWRERGDSPHKFAPVGDNYLWETGNDASLEEAINAQVPSPHLFAILGTSYAGVEGAYRLANRLIAVDPSVTEVGPGALLVDPDILQAGLRKKRWDIVWVVSMEKQATMPQRADYEGYVVARGVYTLRDGVPKGSLTFTHIPPMRSRKQPQRAENRSKKAQRKKRGKRPS